MGWLHITPEQGAIIDSICNQFWSGCKGDGCRKCPLLPACMNEDAPLLPEPDRTEAWERGLWELADQVTRG